MAKVNAGNPPRSKKGAVARVRKAAQPFTQAIKEHGSVSGIPSLKVHKPDDQATDLLRLNDLVKQHGLHYKRVGSTYIFEDFTAHGLKQALGFAEGFDRAKSNN